MLLLYKMLWIVRSRKKRRKNIEQEEIGRDILNEIKLKKFIIVLYIKECRIWSLLRGKENSVLEIQINSGLFPERGFGLLPSERRLLTKINYYKLN